MCPESAVGLARAFFVASSPGVDRSADAESQKPEIPLPGKAYVTTNKGT